MPFYLGTPGTFLQTIQLDLNASLTEAPGSEIVMSPSDQTKTINCTESIEVCSYSEPSTYLLFQIPSGPAPSIKFFNTSRDLQVNKSPFIMGASGGVVAASSTKDKQAIALECIIYLSSTLQPQRLIFSVPLKS